MWMGSNLNHDGLQKVLTSLSTLSMEKEKEKEKPEEINNNWKRLASFMNKNGK